MKRVMRGIFAQVGLVVGLTIGATGCEVACDNEGASWCRDTYIYDCVDGVAESADCADDCFVQGYSSASCVELNPSVAVCSCG